MEFQKESTDDHSEIENIGLTETSISNSLYAISQQVSQRSFLLIKRDIKSIERDFLNLVCIAYYAKEVDSDIIEKMINEIVSQLKKMIESFINNCIDIKNNIYEEKKKSVN